MFGLIQSLQNQDKNDEAAKVRELFDKVACRYRTYRRSFVVNGASCYCCRGGSVMGKGLAGFCGKGMRDRCKSAPFSRQIGHNPAHQTAQHRQKAEFGTRFAKWRRIWSFLQSAQLFYL